MTFSVPKSIYEWSLSAQTVICIDNCLHRYKILQNIICLSIYLSIYRSIYIDMHKPFSFTYWIPILHCTHWARFMITSWQCLGSALKNLGKWIREYWKTLGNFFLAIYSSRYWSLLVWTDVLSVYWFYRFMFVMLWAIWHHLRLFNF